MLSKNQLKLITSLQQKKYRIKHGLFVAEGIKVVSELLNSPISCENIFCTEDFNHDKIEIDPVIISEKELKKISSFKTPNKILGIFKIPAQKRISQEGFIVILDEIKDPGNLGTIIRIADWYGIKQLVVSPNTVDEYNPKTIAATMGSLARVQIIREELQKTLIDYKFPIYSAILNGKSIYDVKKNKTPFCLLIGSESHGISDLLLGDLKTIDISIPRLGKAESLNAAVASGILIDRLLNG